MIIGLKSLPPWAILPSPFPTAPHPGFRSPPAWITAPSVRCPRVKLAPHCPPRFWLPLFLTAAATVLHAQPVTRAADADAGPTSFHFGEGGDKINAYGGFRGMDRPVFFNEWLPGLFERTLVFDKFAPDASALRWIFTGPRGGVTVQLDQKEVVVTQRYYDSYGFYVNDPLTTPGNTPRFPEEEWSRANAPLPGNLTSLTVSIDRHFSLTVRAGHHVLLELPCLLELQQHQLQWYGNGGLAVGKMLSPPTAPAKVVLNPADRHQAIIGFGGMTSPLSYRRLSDEGRKQWWSLLASYNLLIQREYPVGVQLKPDFSNFDNSAAAVPHYYGDNPNDTETSDFAYNRAVLALGGQTWFGFWRLPSWMLPNSGTRGPTTFDPNPSLYADAVVAYCQASAAKAGAPPAIVGVQNELCPSPQALAAMLPALRQKLDAAGFAAVKINMADAGRLAQGAAFALEHHQAGIWPLIDFAASNIYDVQDNFRDADRNAPLFARFKETTDGKDFLSMEVCVNGNAWQSDSYRVALAMGQVFHQDLTLADARAVLYCWLLMHVPEPSFGWTRMLFRVDTSHDLTPVASSDMLRVFGAYSRHIQRGMVRIGAESSDADLLTTAFHADDGRETVVLLNRSMQPRRVTLTGLSFALQFGELADPYHENSPLPEPVEQHDSVATVDVPAGAFVTLSSVPLVKVPADFQVP